MGRGALVLYLDTPENAEVCGDAGLAFEAEVEKWVAVGLRPGDEEPARAR